MRVSHAARAKPCAYCGELIQAGDRQVVVIASALRLDSLHPECRLRQIEEMREKQTQET